MRGITYKLGVDNSAFRSGMDGAMEKLQGLGSMLKSMVGPVAAIAGVASLGSAISNTVDRAAELEKLETAFAPLLGSADAAKERIAELSKFAAETPFELPEIAKASQVLETLTQGALSTGEGLRMVGDIAATTNQPFSEVAVTVGRLYDGLQSGRPVGEAAARLQELGVISGSTRGRIEELQASGAKGAEVWNVARDAMGRFSGAMEAQSATWNGKVSTLKDNIGMMMAEFGTPILDAIKPYLDQVLVATGSATSAAAAFGQEVAAAISFVYQAFSAGDLAAIVGGSLALGFGEAVNDLWKHMQATFAAAGELATQVFKTGVEIFAIIQTPEFWSGIGAILEGIMLGAVGVLRQGIGTAIEVARPLMKLFGKSDADIDRLVTDQFNAADAADAKAGQAGADAAAKLDASIDKITQRGADALDSVAGAYGDGYDKAQGAIDTQSMEKDLAKAIDKTQDAQEAFAAKAAAEAAERDERLAQNKALGASAVAAAENLNKIPGPATDAATALGSIAGPPPKPEGKRDPFARDRVPEGPIKDRNPLKGQGDDFRGLDVKDAAAFRQAERDAWWNEGKLLTPEQWKKDQEWQKAFEERQAKAEKEAPAKPEAKPDPKPEPKPEPPPPPAKPKPEPEPPPAAGLNALQAVAEQINDAVNFAADTLLDIAASIAKWPPVININLPGAGSAEAPASSAEGSSVPDHMTNLGRFDEQIAKWTQKSSETLDKILGKFPLQAVF